MSAGSFAASSRQTVLAALRRSTAAQHRDVEALLPLDDRLTLGAYREVIRGFDVFLSGWEPRLLQAFPPRLRPWAASRSRHALLRHDLRALGVAAAPIRPEALPGLQLVGKAAAFGSLYVLEGSMLGAQVIAPKLARQLGLGQHNGAAYLAGWGADTGAMWREFRERLETEVGSDPAACEAACIAAIQTFTVLSATFREVLRDAAAA